MKKGQKMPEAGRLKLSAALTGRTIPADVRAKMSANHARYWADKPIPAHVREASRRALLGHVPWNKGLRGTWKMSPEQVRQVRERMIGRRTGSANPLWRGGVTGLRNRIYNSWRWKEWRTAIFRRDDYCCQMCGIRNREGVGSTVRIEADHYPVPFVRYLARLQHEVGDGDVFEATMRDHGLWAASGRTLCKSCHNSTKRGRGTRLGGH